MLFLQPLCPREDKQQAWLAEGGGGVQPLARDGAQNRVSPPPAHSLRHVLLFFRTWDVFQPWLSLSLMPEPWEVLGPFFTLSMSISASWSQGPVLRSCCLTQTGSQNHLSLTHSFSKFCQAIFD